MSARDELTAAPLSPEREAEIRAMAVAAPLRIMMEDVVGCRVGLRDLLGEIDRLRADRNAYRAEVLREEARNLRKVEREDTPEGALGTRTGLLRAALILDERADAAEQGEKDTAPAATSTPQPAGTCGRALSTGKPCPDHPVKPNEMTIYRASHESIVMGHYTTAAAAREHCETYARNEHIGDGELALWWREDEDTVDQPEDGTAELIESTHPHYSRPTGYIVTPLTVTSAYDEEADE